MFLYKIAIIIILVFWKLGLVRPVQQKIKLPLPEFHQLQDSVWNGATLLAPRNNEPSWSGCEH